MSKLKLVGAGKIDKHGIKLDFNNETLYTCSTCNEKVSPQDARWIGTYPYCPSCQPEPTQEDE